jgi:hypothetical protein
MNCEWTSGPSFGAACGPAHAAGIDQYRDPQRKAPRCDPRRSSSHQMLEIYFDTDFLNMRSIFSLIASMAVEFD